MAERQSKRTGTKDVPNVDHLLKLLREASKQDPSPAVRERLAAFAAERLHPSPGYAVPIRSRCRKPLVWLKPALAGMVLAVTGLTIVYVLHFRQHVPFETHGTAQESHPSISPDEAKVGSTMRVSVADRSKVQQPRHGLAQSRSTRRMTLQLPYSNSAIETGTDATIRVSMSESELLSLGFPINATLQDRRIAAELTLGDDGLPRAISLSLPLQVMKEKK